MHDTGTTSIDTRNLDVAMRVRNEIDFGETHINREDFAHDAVA